MINTPQTQDKSLLIQTVALFEALLGKIHQLQEENDTLKTTLESNKEVEELSKERDQIIFELEAKYLKYHIYSAVDMGRIDLPI